MSLTSKALLTVATAFASNEMRRVLAEVSVDDVLKTVGLARSRRPWGQSFLLVGAGIAVGGAAAVLLSPSARNRARDWISSGLKQVEAEVEAHNDAPTEPQFIPENHQPTGAYAPS
jgi:hypothetical protein